MNLLKNFRHELQELADPDKALILQCFFKTGKGQYGEGDKFLGIPVPKQRKLIKQYLNLNFTELKSLINSPIHEERLSAVLIMVTNYQKTKEPKFQQKIYEFYLANFKRINNWDLVDLSAPHIIGQHLLNQDKNILHKWAKDKNLWTRRIAIIATFCFIRNGCFQETLSIAKKLLNDKEDLIHKATGWMLREISKRDFVKAENFLKKHYQKMPRTMLRYAIEKFPESKRKAYLKGNV